VAKSVVLAPQPIAIDPAAELRLTLPSIKPR